MRVKFAITLYTKIISKKPHQQHLLKEVTMKKAIIVIFTLLLANLIGCVGATDTAKLQARIDDLQAQIDAHKAERAATAKHLKIFDELDLEAFNKRDMARIKQIHADDVKVYNPDGTITEPMPPHAEELQFLFDTFDFKVAEHIVGFGFGEWTAGISISKGKWIKPITMPDGTVLQPTGRPVSLKIATIARWENDRIAEEYLFWDNADWNRQIGLGQ
jgi:cell division protein FtsB